MKRRRLVLLWLCLLPITSVFAEEDRLNMEGIEIRGNSELPKALYIVPWKDAEQKMSTGKPVDSLTQQLLDPLERDAFQRRLKYVEAGGE